MILVLVLVNQNNIAWSYKVFMIIFVTLVGMNTSYHDYLFNHQNKSAPVVVLTASSHCYTMYHTTLNQMCGYQSRQHGTARLHHVCFIICSISRKYYNAHNPRKGSIIHVRAGVRVMLLLLAGDVETNPGPTGKYTPPLYIPSVK